MKKILLSITIVLLAATVGNSQAPGIFNYQGVARNSVGNVLINQSIKLRLTIHDGTAGGLVVYQESRGVITNPFGLFNVQVGSPGGTNVTGTIAAVPWGVGDKFIQVEIDPLGGSNFLNIGTAQIASVPYALYSSGAGDLVLPFVRSQSSATPLFGITNTGTGVSGFFTVNNAASTSDALQATTNGGATSWAFRATSTGAQGAGIFTYNNAAGAANTIRSTNNGSGAAVSATVTGTGNAGLFNNTNAANSSDVLFATSNGTGSTFDTKNTGTGRAGTFEIANAGNASAVLFAVGNGTNSIGHFANTNAATNASTVFVTTNSTNATALSLSGPGIWGSAMGITNTTSGMEWRTSVNNTTYTVTKVPGATFSPFLLFSDGQVEFPSTASANRLRILDNGNVGLSTATPAYRLDVDATAAGSSNGMRVRNTTSFAVVDVVGSGIDQGLRFGKNGSVYSGINTLPDGDHINFFKFGAGQNLMSLNVNTGNLGVGGTPSAINAVAKVHVRGFNVVNNLYSSSTGFQGATGVGVNDVTAQPTNEKWGIHTFVNGAVGTQHAIFAEPGTTAATNIGLFGRVSTAPAGVGQSFALFAFDPVNTANTWAASVRGRLQYQDGSQGTGKILRSTDANGNASWASLAAAGIIAGGGTLNFIPKWTPDGVTLGNSQVFDDGVNVGIGTTVPATSLDVTSPSGVTYETFHTPGSGAGGGNGLLVGIEDITPAAWFYNYENTTIYIATGGSRITLSPTGAIGINQTSPTANLDVNGTFKLTDGTQGANKVLTSDASGNASWTNPSLLNNVQFRVKGLGGKTISSNTNTDINTWDAVPDYNDGGGVYNAAAGTYTVSKSGLYQINARALWNTATANGYKGLYLMVNGSFAEGSASGFSTVATYDVSTLSASLKLSAGAVVKLAVLQTTGVNQTLSNFPSGYDSVWSLFLIR